MKASDVYIFLILCVICLAVFLRPFEKKPEEISNALLQILRYRNSELEGLHISQNKYSSVPSKVFTFWNTDEIPELCKLSISLLQSKLHQSGEDWKVYFLTPSNLDKFLPGSLNFMKIMVGAGLRIALFSDWLRWSLLLRYGGVWIDSTTIINDVGLLSKWRHVLQAGKKQLFAIRNEKHYNNGDNPVYESWLLISPPSSPLVAATLSEIEKALVMGPRSYCIQANVSVTVRLRLPGSYWASYYALISALHKFKIDSNIDAYSIVASESSQEFGLQLQSKYGYGSSKLVRHLLDSSFLDEKLIKLTHWDRAALKNHEDEFLNMLMSMHTPIKAIL